MFESWEWGMLKIIDECTKAGLPEPAFNYDFNGLMVEFKGATAEASEKTSEKILELVKANPEITIQELASGIGISNSSIGRNFQKLQKENLLKRIGADKGGRWDVVE